MTAPSFTPDDIDPETLTGVARRALACDRLEITEWQHAPLNVRIFSGVTAGLHRISGSGRDRGKPLAWSVVLKMLHRPTAPTAGEPSHPDYWRREALAYQSGLLDDLPAGLSAARCFGVTEPTADVVCLWLEDVAGSFGSAWPRGRFLTAARHLGQFNGAYLAGHALPALPWLSRGWLRSWVARTCAPAFPVLDQPGLWKHPLIAPYFAPTTGAQLRRLCDERERWLDALDQLPQTLCHWDAWRPNLFARRGAAGEEETGAVDWAFVGLGPVGAEIGQLVALDLLMGHVAPAGATELNAQATDAYVAGLREAGWRCDERAVKLGAAALISLRWTLLLPRFLAGAADEGAHAGMEAMLGIPVAALMERWGAACEFLFDQADTARRLLGRGGAD
jgi:hypothetical protein